MKPDTNFQVYPSTAKREKRLFRQVMAIYFQVFFLALQCLDKPENWYQAS